MSAADATFWNELAEDYARKPVELPAAFERKISITRALMRPDHVVLDIGCGTGSLVLRLADGAQQVHGLDLSSEMVRIARHKTEVQGVDNATFHVGPFDDEVPFDDASLDGLCAYSLLHLLEDREAALARIFRLLKPGGFFVSSTVVLGETWIPYRPVLAVMRWLGKAPLVTIFDKATLKAELAAAGFVGIEEHEVGAKPTTAFLVAHKPE